MVECISYRQKQNETWRYFSYSLVHADVAHLRINMLCLVGLGTLLHMTNRTVVLLLLYVLGVKKQLSTGCVNCHLFPAGSIRVNGLLCLWRKFSATGWVQWRRLLSCWYLSSSWHCSWSASSPSYQSLSFVNSSIRSSSVYHGLLHTHLFKFFKFWAFLPIYIHNSLSLSFSVRFTPSLMATSFFFL